MSRTHLGKTIDLHCGGQDLIFPHHENEIAQSECANGCTFARYWMHNGFINVDNQKMSKSLHNFFTVRDVADVYGYEPIRYFMLTAGYRMPLNYTVDLIESCKNSLERLYTCRENLDFALTKDAFGTDETLKEKAAEARTKFCTAMDDDLNTPGCTGCRVRSGQGDQHAVGCFLQGCPADRRRCVRRDHRRTGPAVQPQEGRGARRGD